MKKVETVKAECLLIGDDIAWEGRPHSVVGVELGSLPRTTYGLRPLPVVHLTLRPERGDDKPFPVARNREIRLIKPRGN